MEGPKTGRCLIDTNILVDHFRNVPVATDFILSERKKSKIWISTITLAEIFSGKMMADARVRARVIRFLGLFRVAAVDGRIAVVAGTIVRMHKAALPDALIAATALVRECRLYTRNLKRFESIENLAVMAPF